MCERGDEKIWVVDTKHGGPNRGDKESLEALGHIQGKSVGF